MPLDLKAAGPAAADDRHRLPQRAYSILRNAIRELRLSPGQMVLERDLAHSLGMSRTPVREALVQLQAEGLLRLVPRHGLQVAPLAPDELQEIYEIVEGLEGQAVGLAAERTTPAGVAELERLLKADVAALEADDLLAWVEADDRFHSKIVELSGNRRLRQLMANYEAHIYRARLMTIKLRPRPTKSTQEHRAVIAAIRAHDAKRARALYQAHRHRARNEILGILRAMSPETRKGRPRRPVPDARMTGASHRDPRRT